MLRFKDSTSEIFALNFVQFIVFHSGRRIYQAIILFVALRSHTGRLFGLVLREVPVSAWLSLNRWVVLMSLSVARSARLIH